MESSAQDSGSYIEQAGDPHRLRPFTLVAAVRGNGGRRYPHHGEPGQGPDYVTELSGAFGVCLQSDKAVASAGPAPNVDRLRLDRLAARRQRSDA